jgi:hypothetical protein
MIAKHAPPARWRPWVLAGILFVMAFDAAWLWQRFAGAQASDLGGHPREAAQFLEALAVRDYLAMGTPVPGAEARVPPGLDAIVAGAWLAVFGAGKTSALFCEAAIVALVAALLFLAVRPSLGDALACVAACGWLLLPRTVEIVQLACAAALPSLLLLGAAAAFGWFLDAGKNRAAMLWGVCAAGGVLTGASGLAAAALAPLGLLAGMRSQAALLKRPGLWAGAALAGAAAWVALPWAFLRDAGLRADGANPGLAEAAIFQAAGFGFALGGLLAVLFIVGVVGWFAKARSAGGFWICAAAGLAALVVVALAPPGPLDANRLAPGLPLAMAFVAAGIESVRENLRRRRGAEAGAPSGAEIGLAMVLLGGGLFFAHGVAPVQKKAWSGFGTIADYIAQHPGAQAATILVCSDRRGEAMFAAEAALRGSRTGGWTVITVTEGIARLDRGASAARPRFDTEDELAGWLPRSGIDFVLIDPSMTELGRTPAHDQIMRVCERSVDKVWPVATAPLTRPGAGASEVPVDLKLFEVRRARQ